MLSSMRHPSKATKADKNMSSPQTQGFQDLRKTTLLVPGSCKTVRGTRGILNVVEYATSFKSYTDEQK